MSTINTEILEKIEWYESQINRPRLQRHQRYLNQELVPNSDLFTQAEIVSYGEKVDNYNNFIRMVREFDNGTFETSHHLVVTPNTPSYMQSLGFENRAITHTQRHLSNELRHKDDTHSHHGIPRHVMYQLPEKLEKPWAVIRTPSENASNAILVFLDALDEDNFPIFAAIAPNRDATFDIRVESANQARNFEYLEKAIQEDPSRLIYFDPSIAERFASTEGLQLPSSCANLSHILIENGAVAINDSKKEEIKQLLVINGLVLNNSVQEENSQTLDNNQDELKDPNNVSWSIKNSDPFVQPTIEYLDTGKTSTYFGSLSFKQALDFIAQELDITPLEVQDAYLQQHDLDGVVFLPYSHLLVSLQKTFENSNYDQGGYDYTLFHVNEDGSLQLMSSGIVDGHSSLAEALKTGLDLSVLGAVLRADSTPTDRPLCYVLSCQSLENHYGEDIQTTTDEFNGLLKREGIIWHDLYPEWDKADKPEVQKTEETSHNDKTLTGILFEPECPPKIITFTHDSFADLYPIIDCDTFDVVGGGISKIDGNEWDIFVDDEGILNQKPANLCVWIDHETGSFKVPTEQELNSGDMPDHVLFGNALVLGMECETGETISLLPEDFENVIKTLSVQADYFNNTLFRIPNSWNVNELEHIYSYKEDVKPQVVQLIDACIKWQESNRLIDSIREETHYPTIESIEQLLRKQDAIVQEARKRVGNDKDDPDYYDSLGYTKTKIQIDYRLLNQESDRVFSFVERYDVGDGQEYMNVKESFEEFIKHVHHCPSIELVNDICPDPKDLNQAITNKDIEGTGHAISTSPDVSDITDNPLV